MSTRLEFPVSYAKLALEWSLSPTLDSQCQEISSPHLKVDISMHVSTFVLRRRGDHEITQSRPSQPGNFKGYIITRATNSCPTYTLLILQQTTTQTL